MYPPAPSKQREHWPVHPGSLLYIKEDDISYSVLCRDYLTSLWNQDPGSWTYQDFRHPISCQRFNVAVAQVGWNTPLTVNMVHPEIYGLPFLQRKIIFQFNMFRFSGKIFGGYLEDHLEILFLTRVESVCLGPFNNILDPRWILFTGSQVDPALTRVYVATLVLMPGNSGATRKVMGLLVGHLGVAWELPPLVGL